MKLILKQIDFNGQFEYSKIVSVSLEEENRQVGNFYPNPSTLGLFSLSYTYESAATVNLTVFDITGKVVLNQSHSVFRGRNILKLKVPASNRGTLITRVDNGVKQFYRKLLLE